MTFRFTQTAQPANNLSIRLEKIYDVKADSKYDVTYGNREEGYAVFRTLSGEGRIILNNGKIEDQTDESLILVKWDSVSRYLCQGKKWNFLWFCFQAEGYLPLPLNRTVNLPHRGEDRILIDQCLELTGIPYEEAGALGSSLLAMLIHRWSYERILAVNPRSAYQQKTDRVINIMKQNLDRKLTSSELASIAGLSERRFRDVFHGVTGCSPREYYNRLRMEHGANMLSLSDLSLGEVAEKLGFCDPFHFSKCFKSNYGCSPREFRQSLRKK
ncbi:MAG: helix-turn-helix transcriptional regulator [Spirochaetales bacterium]|nr:helix-turn-helix transcriptional regulator [Spirochaetales bacterium]